MYITISTGRARWQIRQRTWYVVLAIETNGDIEYPATVLLLALLLASSHFIETTRPPLFARSFWLVHIIHLLHLLHIWSMLV